MSTDSAQTWKKVNTAGRFGCREIAIASRSGTLFLLDTSARTSSYSGFQRSTDNGLTWKRIKLDGWKFETARFDPDAPNNVVMAQEPDQNNSPTRDTAFLWRSTDGGLHWRRALHYGYVPTANGRGERRTSKPYRPLGEPLGAVGLIVGGGRFIVGPLVPARAFGLKTSKACRYLQSTDHGASWHVVRAPLITSTGSGPAEFGLPDTVLGVGTPYADFARALNGPTWRLDRGSQRWTKPVVTVYL